MIVALDVQYDDLKSLGMGAAVVFSQWEDATPTVEYTALVENIQPYVPGEFFKRELPCLIAVIEKVREPIDCVVVDGYVMLGGKRGLGMHLWEHFERRIPVVGVAKSIYHEAQAVEVLRGESKSPLHVTAIGVDPQEAASHIRSMHGPYRIPTLLKQVDHVAKSGCRAVTGAP